MASVKAHISAGHYHTDIASAGGNHLIADEPPEHGGKDEGFSPSELLCASLAACTSITLRMYADRKGWPLEKAEVEVSLSRDTATNITAIKRNITLHGALTDVQKERLLDIANKCPVHQTLTHPITIDTTVL